MISPVSSGAAAYVQNAQAAKPQSGSKPASQASGSSSTQDTVELSAQAQAALSGGSSKTESKPSTYAPPSTVVAHSSKAGAAS
jgi:hypothetical protein